MKKIIIPVVVIATLLTLCSCTKNEISIDKEESFYSRFEVINEKVMIYCTILVENPTKAEREVTLSANFEDDVKLGLLKEAQLDGYRTDLETKSFTINKGDNWIDVVFIGEHAGENKKYDRLLPEIQMEMIK